MPIVALSDTLRDVIRFPPDSGTDGSSPSTTPFLATTSDAVLPIGEGWSAALSRRVDGALLRIVRGGDARCLEIAISLTADGPVIRAQAAALEIQTEGDIVARCESFRVEARDSVELSSAGAIEARGRRVDVEATHGAARIRANDNVQLLGENVLLTAIRRRCLRPPGHAAR